MMWMVWDTENGLVGIHDDHKKAKEEYEDHKRMILEKESIDEDDQVILAKIEKHSLSDEAVDDSNYWELKESVY